MKVLTIWIMAMCITGSLSACESELDNEREILEQETIEEETTETEEESNSNEDNDMITTVKITVNGQTLTVTLEDNVTAKAFAQMLPITLPMMDLYGREMCYRFPEALPTDNAYSRGYEVGEIVYYPPMHSFVILYAQNGERFQMQSIGRINSGVNVFNGIGDVDVQFEAAE